MLDFSLLDGNRSMLHFKVNYIWCLEIRIKKVKVEKVQKKNNCCTKARLLLNSWTNFDNFDKSPDDDDSSITSSTL